MNNYRKKPADTVTIESVKENWSKVVDMKNAKHLKKLGDVTLDLVSSLQVTTNNVYFSRLSFAFCMDLKHGVLIRVIFLPFFKVGCR